MIESIDDLAHRLEVSHLTADPQSVRAMYCDLCERPLRRHNRHGRCHAHGRSRSFDSATGRCLICSEIVSWLQRGAHALAHARPPASEEDVKAKQRSAQQRTRNARVERGVCRDCGQRPPLPKRLVCDGCAKKQLARGAVWRRSHGRKVRVPVTFTHDGQTLSLAEWSRRTGVPLKIIWQRLVKLGWPADRILEPTAVSRARERARNRDKPVCAQGHPRTPENIYTSRRGNRMCRVCMRDRNRARRQSLAADQVRRRNLIARPVAVTGFSNEELVGRAKVGAGWATAQLITQNDRFVEMVARKYLRRCRSLQLGDLVAAGRMGILYAVGKYEPATGNKFLTYASWWVRHYITREIADNDLAIRIPVHVQEVQAAVYNGTFDGSDTKRVRAKLVEQLRKVRSLDAPVSDDADSRTLGELVADPAIAPVDEQLSSARLAAAVRDTIRSMGLNDRERAIVERRLMGEATLDDVAQPFGVSRERVRQIEEKLRDKLRRALAGIAEQLD